jgi:hypothetical protein
VDLRVSGYTSLSEIIFMLLSWISVGDPYPGSGAFFTLDPGSVIGFFSGSRVLDPETQTHIFESLMTIFCVKITIILSVLDKKIFFTSSKRKIL